VADEPETEEVLVTGGSWSNPGDDWWKLQELYQRLSEQAGAYNPTGDAFMPPVPVTLPEVKVTPPPVKPKPIVPTAQPGLLNQVLRGGLGLLGLLVPGNMGGPGEGDAPTESSSVAARGDPPKPPPTIQPAFEDIEPPNWEDLARGGKSDLLDPVVPRYVPLPEVPPVEMPDGTKFFDVSPPRPTPNPYFDLWSFPDYGPGLETITFPTGPGPGPAPTPTGTPGVNPAPGYPEIGDFPVPGILPQPSRPGAPAPDVFGSPLPDVFGDPLGDPFVTPTSPPRSIPDTSNPVRNRPGDTSTPTGDPFGLGFPLPNANPRDYFAPADQPSPQQFPQDPGRPPTKDRDCSCAEKKPKKPKKRQPRTVCYRGTYRQNARGISYKKLEEIPCESSKTTKRAGGLPGLSLTGEQATDLVSQAMREFTPIIDEYLARKYPKPKKPKKETKKRNRRGKTTTPRQPGTVYTSPFPNDPF